MRLSRVVAMAGVWACSGVATAQDAVVASAAAGAERVALMDLRFRESPTREDYALAGELLGIAQERAPADAELLRRRIEAAYNAGDEAETLRLTRELVRLDPADTVAQLRLITARIAREDTAEARLSLYARFLGEGGRSLDASVRSRLALDAALLAREQGDAEHFVRLLEQATSLDSTHKEAATLAATFYATSVDDVRGRAELLSNLLLADPLDPNVHLSLSREMARAGAIEGARRFQRDARAIMEAASIPARVEHVVGSLVLDWLGEGPVRAVEELNARLASDREQLRREVFQRYGPNPDASAPRPIDVRLALEFELVRVAAAMAAGDAETADRAMSDYERTQGENVKRLSDPSGRPAEMTPDEAQEAIRRVAIDVQLVRMWTGAHAETALTELASSNLSAEVTDPGERVLHSLRRTREGAADEAIAILEPLVDEHPLARVALAQAYDAAGRAREAGLMYRESASRQPVSVIGAWSRSKGEVLGAYGAEDGLIEREMESLARSVPSWVDDLASDPRRFVSLSVEAGRAQVTGLETPRVVVKIRNASPVPLALGPDRPINSRVLLAPRPVGDEARLFEIARPEVVDLDRRLRLMPRESVEAVVALDRGFTGWLLDAYGARGTRQRWRAIQGFVMGGSGTYEPGPMCLATDSEVIGRSPLGETRLDHASFVARVGAMTDAEAPVLARAMLARAIDAGAPAFTEGEAAEVASAFAARYPALGEDARLVLATTLPPGILSPAMTIVDSAMFEEESPDVLAFVLVTRVRRADHEALARAKASADPTLARVAGLVESAIERGSRGFSRDDLASIVRPGPER